MRYVRCIWVFVMFILSFNVLPFLSYAQDSPNQCDEPHYYTIVKNDFLYKIGMKYGDSRFWEAIYVANAPLMADPNLIFPGQKLFIPHKIAGYPDNGFTAEEVLENPFCEKIEVPVTSVKEQFLIRYDIKKISAEFIVRKDTLINMVSGENESVSDTKKLEEFREAFNALVEAQQEKKQKSNKRNREQIIRMEVDGMVLDETISKIGRDFYSVFYQYWEAPEKAYNYTISISEQPSPSLGTIVTVEVNDTPVYRSRLQPRYEIIEQASKQAVRNTHHYVKNNMKNFVIY